MNAKLLKIWDRLRTSFWFLPSLMAAGAIGFGFGAVALDRSTSLDWLPNQAWAYTGSAEGASTVLGTIAGSMMTIAGVVFSMTLVALSLASTQFGPRLLRNFMQDKVYQVVLGTFVAAFLYSLTVLRSIRRGDDNEFVPQLSVTIGVFFALAGIAVLIYFIHHVSVTVQAGEVVARVGRELVDEVESLFPEQIGRPGVGPSSAAPDPALPDAFEREAVAVEADGDGYLEFVDAKAVMTLATEHDLVLRLLRRPGQYVVKGSPLAAVWPPGRLTDELRADVRGAFALGRQQTPGQDIEFSIRQLVEVAVRSLSPSVNDPFTAIACIDRLGSALCRIAQREMPSPHRLDPHGALRVVAPPVTFPEIVDASLDQIRQYGRTSAAVTIRLLEMIATVAEFVSRAEDRAALERQAEMVERGAREGLRETEDRRKAEMRFRATLRALDGAGSTRNHQTG